MKQGKILIAAVILLTLFSCSKFSQLLKSEDIQLKYDEALRYYQKKDYRRAATLFENIIPNISGTSKDDTVMFYLGSSYYYNKEYELSGEMMDAYRNRFSRAPFTEEAEYLYAMSYYKTSGEAERDQSNTNRAILAFNEFLNRHPESDRAADIHRMIEELTQKLYVKEYLNASLYYKIGYYNSAITALRSAIKQHPEIPQKEEMMYLISKSWFEYAKGSETGRQLDRYLKMIDSYYNFKSEYPDGSKYDKDLASMFEFASQYTERNGTQARELEQSLVGIKQHKEKIEENKELIFNSKDPDVRDRLRREIADLRKTIRIEKKAVNAEKKTLKKNNKGQKPQKLRTKSAKKDAITFDELEKQAIETPAAE